MQTPTYVENQIDIAAPAVKVWDVLTNPEQTKKYMFGCETVSDWKEGSPLLWKGNFGGQELVAVEGIIKQIDPDRLLAYTVIDPNSGMENTPENYLTVTYALAEQEGHTLLTVTQGDYSIVADGEKRYQEAYNGGEGWNPILLQIKQLAEEK